MMYNYPWTDADKINLDWLIKTVKETKDTVDSATTYAVEKAVAQAKAYTDSKVAEQTEQVEEAVRDINEVANRLEYENAQFMRVVNSQVDIMNSRINAFRNEIEADINAVNNRTDLAIHQNNEYIINEVSKFLSQIKVINYFTGESIGVQEMFDYLAHLHTENGITYKDLAERCRTYTELAHLNMTYTQLAFNGGSIII